MDDLGLVEAVGEPDPTSEVPRQSGGRRLEIRNSTALQLKIERISFDLAWAPSLSFGASGKPGAVHFLKSSSGMARIALLAETRRILPHETATAVRYRSLPSHSAASAERLRTPNLA